MAASTMVVAWLACAHQVRWRAIRPRHRFSWTSANRLVNLQQNNLQRIFQVFLKECVMKSIVLPLLVSLLVSACGSAPILNAEKKEIVFVHRIDMIYPKVKSSEVFSNVVSAVVHAKTGISTFQPHVERAQNTPSDLKVYWSGKEDPILVSDFINIPYTSWLEKNLLAGEWVYYYPNVQDKTKMFVPCNDKCGPPGTPTLFALKVKAKHLHKMQEEKHETERLARIRRFVDRKASTSEFMKMSAANRAARNKREEALRQELKRIEAAYKRSHR